MQACKPPRLPPSDNRKGSIMKNADSIMVATDMSDFAAMAEDRAAMLCKQLQKERLDIINVQDLSVIDMLTRAMKSSADLAEKALREGVTGDLQARAQRLESTYGIKCEPMVRFGKAATEIVQETVARKTGLLVVGAHGEYPNSHEYLGNVPGKLLQVSPASVLVVRNKPVHAYDKIMIAIDFTEISRYQALQALELATPKTEIVFIHAYEVPNEGIMRHEFRSDIRIKAGAEMQAFIADLKITNHVTSVIQLGVPHTVIKEHVRTRNPDLLVMGKLGRSRIEEFILGSTSRNAIYETRCDIMIVPPTAVAAQMRNAAGHN